MIVDAVTVHPVISDQLMTALDELQCDLALAHAAFTADHHADAIDDEQLAMHRDRLGQPFIEPGDDVDDRMIGLFLTAEDRKVLFQRAFPQDMRTLMPSGDDDGRRFFSGQKVKRALLRLLAHRMAI